MFKNLFSLYALSMTLFMVLFLSMSCTTGNTPPPSIGTATANPGDDTEEGKIIEIQSDGTILILPETGRGAYVEPLANAKITRNGKPVKAVELRVGDVVWVRYMSDSLPDFLKALEIRATGKD